MCFTFRQLGTHYPDQALAVVSAAGWIKKEDYGESNLFFRHDISTSHTSPAVKGILEACTAENDADKHVSNLHVSYLMVLLFEILLLFEWSHTRALSTDFKIRITWCSILNSTT